MTVLTIRIHISSLSFYSANFSFLSLYIIRRYVPKYASHWMTEEKVGVSWCCEPMSLNYSNESQKERKRVQISLYGFHVCECKGFRTDSQIEMFRDLCVRECKTDKHSAKLKALCKHQMEMISKAIRVDFCAVLLVCQKWSSLSFPWAMDILVLTADDLVDGFKHPECLRSCSNVKICFIDCIRFCPMAYNGRTCLMSKSFFLFFFFHFDRILIWEWLSSLVINDAPNAALAVMVILFCGFLLQIKNTGCNVIFGY